MKFFFTLFGVLFVGSLFAQTRYSERMALPISNSNHVLFSPFYFLDGTFMLTYERLFSSGALRITPSIKLQNIDDQHYSQREGWGLDFGYKFILTNRPRKVNFYLGPYALYKNIKVKSPVYLSSSSYYPLMEPTTYAKKTYNILGMGVDSGVKFIFGRFVMDISFGGGIRYAYIDGYSYANSGAEWFDIDYKGIVPRGNISFGVAF